MKVYLAHNFAARDWLKKWVIPILEKEGHEVTSRWITDDRHLDPTYKDSAGVDLQDIERAGAIVFFANQFGDTPGAGKFVELGYAIRAGKIVIVVGEGRCVFYSLCSIRQIKSTENDWMGKVLAYLGSLGGGNGETKISGGSGLS